MVVSRAKIDTIIPEGWCVSDYTTRFKTPFESPLLCVERVKPVICRCDIHRAVGNNRARLNWSSGFIFPQQLERRFEGLIRASTRKVQIVHEHRPIFRAGGYSRNDWGAFRLGFPVEISVAYADLGIGIPHNRKKLIKSRINFRSIHPPCYRSPKFVRREQTDNDFLLRFSDLEQYSIRISKRQ